MIEWLTAPLFSRWMFIVFCTFGVAAGYRLRATLILLRPPRRRTPVADMIEAALNRGEPIPPGTHVLERTVIISVRAPRAEQGAKK